jgi:hypothetical protein
METQTQISSKLGKDNTVVFLHYKISTCSAAGVSALVFIRHVNL